MQQLQTQKNYHIIKLNFLSWSPKSVIRVRKKPEKTWVNAFVAIYQLRGSYTQMFATTRSWRLVRSGKALINAQYIGNNMLTNDCCSVSGVSKLLEMWTE